ncbi:MAG: sulfatase-like hydrolase/transferase [Alistipes sp.]|nr:sulfatase-like hydrolase/transferase [Alistipes sp.]
MNSCLANNLTIPYLYDYINPFVYNRDIDLVKEYENIAPSINANLPKLVMFHLLGQHTEYKERYPGSETVFTKDDYQLRTDLNDKQKEIVAHYDNATLYNDKVVSSIIDLFRDEDAIVIYLSDHGDEVYDYRDHYGRSHEPIITKGRAMHQYEVPFMIWVSDKYKETHPDIIKRIENSVDRPFMTDDLPHLMLDLAGIECEWFEPSRSLINDQYNVNRKRLLEDSKQDYDEIMKSASLN